MSGWDGPEGAGDAAGEGCWLQLLAANRNGPPRPALFLDRDGVVIEDVNYLHRPEHVRLIPGAGAALAEMARRGWRLVLITNQSGIGRGYYGWDDFRAVQARLAGKLADEGAKLDAVLACPYHAEAKPPYDRPDHLWRKPAPGMILTAAGQLPLDLARSWMVGDKASDAEAGRAAGLAGAIHVLTGKGRAARAAVERLGREEFRVRVADSIADVPALLADEG